MYQVRYDGGALRNVPTLAEALDWVAKRLITEHSRGFDKISWSCGEGRMILHYNGEWEFRTADSINKLIEERKDE